MYRIPPGRRYRRQDLHQVSQAECEEAFFNRPILIAPDEKHSQGEPRYAALGRTHTDRLLAVIFTVRGSLLRIISARDMSRRERRVYEEARQVQ
jgi:hypothetical protein